MIMVERWPVKGAEIQVYELTPKEVIRQNKRDNRARRRAILRYYLHRIFGLK